MKAFTISLMFVSCLCILIALIKNIVNTEHAHLSPRNGNPIHFQGGDENLWWFVQLTDIHISKFDGSERPKDLINFCHHHLPKIAPELVIVTGDLTDAKFLNRRGSMQYLEEWKRYEEVVTLCQKYNNEVKWFDLRGNHDAFNVPDLNDRQNLFKVFSEQGGINPASYKYTHKQKFGEYTFIAMDATPDPGPKRPFNFFGYLRENQMKLLQKFSTESRSSNMTFWFGHYPTSLVVTEDRSDVRELMRGASAYFCGHLHMMEGLEMYTRHRSGTFEVELGDWKLNRMYRIVAVDNDVMSFSDQPFHEEPVIIFTNPQHAKFPASKNVTSTHIRLLVFPPSKLITVHVFIDNVIIGTAKNVKGPLYVLPWQPYQFSNGLHQITAVVKEEGFTIREKTQAFSLDGTTEPYQLFGRLILMLNFYLIGKCLFYFLAVVYVLVLSLLRKCADIKSIQLQGDVLPGRCLRKSINLWVYRLWLVSKATNIFGVLIFFTIYIVIGPWFIAEVIDGHTGIMFAWGLIVKGMWLPGSLTYVYGIFQIVSFNIPLLFHVGYVMDYPQSFSEANRIRLSHRLRHLYLPMASLLIFQTYVTLIEFPQSYGTKAMILGPVRTGSIFVGIYCYYVALTYHRKSSVHSR
ncbi:transmembrane protein 62-like [Crassostrea virginica]